MVYDCYNSEFFDMLESYLNKAIEILTQKSVVLLIIQGVLLAFSMWDKNSRFFVILAVIGIYSVYGSLSVRISIRRMETEARKLDESRKKQYDLKINVRRTEQLYSELFIPEKELPESKGPHIYFYLKDNYSKIYA